MRIYGCLYGNLCTSSELDIGLGKANEVGQEAMP
jgi:hypothetical protein